MGQTDEVLKDTAEVCGPSIMVIFMSKRGYICSLIDQAA